MPRCLHRSRLHLVFDETKFPFADLHSNAGALLREEILLLPPHLSGIDQGGLNYDDQPLTHPLTNGTFEFCDEIGETRENNEANSGENGEENASYERHLMCRETGGRSASGSVRQAR